MITPQYTPSVSSTPAPTWRGIVLWLVFAVTLLTGLVLALRFGAGVPTLLDGGLR